VQRGIDYVSQHGGTLVFTPGTYVTGTVYLKSNVSIRLENGAVWKGIEDLQQYPLLTTGVQSRMDMVPRRAMIYAVNAGNITISGEGVLYPSGDAAVFQNGVADSPDRPYGIQMVNCHNISVLGIQMRNSAFWMQRYFQCRNIRIDGVTIWNHANLNNDGIDIDNCSNVIIANCNIDSSDDALVFKSEGNNLCTDVVVTNCILSSHASALKLGTGSVGGFERFAISNISIRPSRATVMHHPLKSWIGLNAIDLSCVDGGVMRNINIHDIVIDSIETAFFIRLGSRHSRPWEQESYRGRGRVENIFISDVIATNIGSISSSITGVPDAKVRNVRFENIYLSVTGGGTLADCSLDVANNDRGYPVNRMFRTKLPAYGFYVRHVDGISFRNVEVVALNPDNRSAIVFDDVRQVVADQLRLHVAAGGRPAITVRQGRDIQINAVPSRLLAKEVLEVVDSTSEGIILKGANRP
jgi:polygalacturonase